MSELRSALESFEAEDLDSTPEAVLEEGLEELQRAAQGLELERLRWLAAVDRRQPFLRDGYLSTSSWFAQRHHVAYSTAMNDVRMARALEAMPRTREAAAAGHISTSATRILAAARETDKEAFAESEPLLVDAAIRHSVRDLQRVTAHWRNGVDSRKVFQLGEDSFRERRHLHISPTVFGMVRIDGDLDPETGETVLTALQSSVDAEIRSADPDDRRTPGQRRADALGEICRRWLDSSDRPQVGGERPHITVTVQMDALLGTGPGEFDHVGSIDGETVRRLTCEAAVSRVVLGPRSEPLDVGRRTPVVPPAMRRAVVIRDKECRFPGCDRPPGWCDAHHVLHWAEGGHTSLSNLVLLCRRHHRLVHHGFSVQMADERPVFRRPDGTLLEERAPP
jgi:uncharacterized protein DUF222/HNH endonuclease